MLLNLRYNLSSWAKTIQKYSLVVECYLIQDKLPYAENNTNI